MKKSCFAILLAALLSLFLLPATAYADYDEVVSYDVTAAPNAQDGSISFTVAFDWKALEELPYGQELKIGIPNGSVREVTAQTDNIERLENDNSYMYVYLTRAYDAGETFRFAYSWVQEYMYELDENGVVSYDYTPGWFDEARVDHMTVTWQESDELDGEVSYYADDSDCWTVDGMTLIGTDLPYGSQVHLYAEYSQWPTVLSGEGSRSNMPEEEWPDYYDDYYYDDSGIDPGEVFGVIVILVIAAVIVLAVVASRNDGYAGGFGTHYVYVNHLWYPAGPDGRPKPGSTGTAHKPAPPVRHSSGGLGGGSRGGGFGGGGFGGGSHCACASSCACACACACAGGGRAGCSAKNLYGAIHLDADVTARLER